MADSSSDAFRFSFSYMYIVQQAWECTAIKVHRLDNFYHIIMYVYMCQVSHSMPEKDVFQRKLMTCLRWNSIPPHSALQLSVLSIYCHENINEPQLPRLRTAFKA